MTWLNKISVPLARVAVFVVYFWFGILKLFYISPANPLVSDLLHKTLPFVTFNQFIIFLGIVEMVIGVLFLIPGLEILAFIILILHMGTTVMPLFLLPAVTWQSSFVPTLEGQYIIKNILIISCAVTILAGRNRPTFGS